MSRRCKMPTKGPKTLPKRPKKVLGVGVTQTVLDVLRKAYGVEAGMLMSEASQASTNALEIGISAFDYGVLGIGGIPARNFIEIYGKEGVGKTSLLLQMISGLQCNGYTVLVMDPKMSVADDTARAARIGVDTEKVVLLNIETTEDALDRAKLMLQELNKKGIKIAFVWDDMGLAPTKAGVVVATTEKQRNKSAKPGDKAKIMWDFCRTLSGTCYRCGVPMIIVNQLIDNIGGFGGFKSQTTTGGGGVRYAARIRIKLTVKCKIKVGDVVVGQEVIAKTEKNAFFKPFQSVLLYLDYQQGYLDRESTMLNAVDTGVVRKVKGLYSGKRLCDWSNTDMWDLENRLWPWMNDPENYLTGASKPSAVDDELDDFMAVSEDED